MSSGLDRNANFNRIVVDNVLANKIELKNDGDLSEKLKLLDDKIDTEVQTLEAKHESDLQTLEAKHESDIQTLENKIETEVQTLEAKHVSDIQTLEAKHESDLQTLEAKLETEVQEINNVRKEDINNDIESLEKLLKGSNILIPDFNDPAEVIEIVIWKLLEINSDDPTKTYDSNARYKNYQNMKNYYEGPNGAMVTKGGAISCDYEIFGDSRYYVQKIRFRTAEDLRKSYYERLEGSQFVLTGNKDAENGTDQSVRYTVYTNSEYYKQQAERQIKEVPIGLGTNFEKFFEFLIAFGFNFGPTEEITIQIFIDTLIVPTGNAPIKVEVYHNLPNTQQLSSNSILYSVSDPFEYLNRNFTHYTNYEQYYVFADSVSNSDPLDVAFKRSSSIIFLDTYKKTVKTIRFNLDLPNDFSVVTFGAIEFAKDKLFANLAASKGIPQEDGELLQIYTDEILCYTTIDELIKLEDKSELKPGENLKIVSTANLFTEEQQINTELITFGFGAYQTFSYGMTYDKYANIIYAFGANVSCGFAPGSFIKAKSIDLNLPESLWSFDIVKQPDGITDWVFSEGWTTKFRKGKDFWYCFTVLFNAALTKNNDDNVYKIIVWKDFNDLSNANVNIITLPDGNVKTAPYFIDEIKYESLGITINEFGQQINNYSVNLMALTTAIAEDSTSRDMQLQFRLQYNVNTSEITNTAMKYERSLYRYIINRVRDDYYISRNARNDIINAIGPLLYTPMIANIAQNKNEKIIIIVFTDGHILEIKL